MTDRHLPIIRPLGQPGDLGWIVMAHGELYDREFGWNTDFEAFVAGIVADYTHQPAPGPQAGWIAERDGQRVGCVLCVRGPQGSAQLRLLLVDPAARDTGLGTCLVQECVTFARDAGYPAITLWTNDVLDAARHVYRRLGFELVDEQAHHSYGHDLLGQTWQRTL